MQELETLLEEASELLVLEATIKDRIQGSNYCDRNCKQGFRNIRLSGVSLIIQRQKKEAIDRVRHDIKPVTEE